MVRLTDIPLTNLPPPTHPRKKSVLADIQNRSLKLEKGKSAKKRKTSTPEHIMELEISFPSQNCIMIPL